MIDCVLFGETSWLITWDGLDFAAIDAVVDATHRYHEIFYDKHE
jgi:hypothetical protein